MWAALWPALVKAFATGAAGAAGSALAARAAGARSGDPGYASAASSGFQYGFSSSMNERLEDQRARAAEAREARNTADRVAEQKAQFEHAFKLMPAREKAAFAAWVRRQQWERDNPPVVRSAPSRVGEWLLGTQGQRDVSQWISDMIRRWSETAYHPGWDR